jgi:hypothetical protein
MSGVSQVSIQLVKCGHLDCLSIAASPMVLIGVVNCCGQQDDKKLSQHTRAYSATIRERDDYRIWVVAYVFIVFSKRL